MTPFHPLCAIRRLHLLYGMAVVLFVGMSGWLADDFRQERDRTLNDVSQFVMYESQLLGSLFANTLLAADYVLRDVSGHLDVDHANITSQTRMTALVEEKLETVPGMFDLVVLDAHCTFVAIARTKHLVGKRSRQHYCEKTHHPAGQSLYIQYMPAETSANGKSVVLMSRVIATEQGQMLGSSMAVMDMEYAQSWLGAFPMRGLDVRAILDKDGVLLARHPPLPETLGKPIAASIEGVPLEQHRGTFHYTLASPLDGHERAYGFTRMEQFPFVVIVGHDKERALDMWRQRVWQFALGYLVVTILLLALMRAHLRTVRQGEVMLKMATTDALTNIANRRQLLLLGEQEVQRARRYAKPLTVLMIDIDHFKRINDRWGHATGDQVIRHITDTMCHILRNVDVFGCLGGEEFTAVLPETNKEGAIAFAERFRMAVEGSESCRSGDGEVIRFTVSIGVAEIKPEDTTFDTLLQHADAALYRAKEAGRNHVCATP